MYKKSRTLFALNVAKKSPNRRYILCEGYMDVISMHQAGFDTAVAGCGTALPAEHVKLLSGPTPTQWCCATTRTRPGRKPRRAPSSCSPIRRSSCRCCPSPARKTRRIHPHAGARPLRHAAGRREQRHRVRAGQGEGPGTTSPRTTAAWAICRRRWDVLAGRVTAIERDVYAARLEAETNVSKSAILAQLEAGHPPPRAPRAEGAEPPAFARGRGGRHQGAVRPRRPEGRGRRVRRNSSWWPRC